MDLPILQVTSCHKLQLPVTLTPSGKTQAFSCRQFLLIGKASEEVGLRPRLDCCGRCIGLCVEVGGSKIRVGDTEGMVSFWCWPRWQVDVENGLCCVLHQPA